MTTNKHILLLAIALIVIVLKQDAYAQQMPTAYAQGRSLYDDGRYEAAAASFTQALSQLNKMKGTWVADSERVVMTQLTATYSEARKKNIPFKNLDFDNSNTEEFWFPITSVLSANDDSAIVLVDGGTQDGIFWGAETNAFASPATSKTDTARTWKYFGRTHIIELSDYVCKVVIKFSKARKGFKVYRNDLVEIGIHPIRNHRKNVLYRLESINISFKDNNKETLIDKHVLLYNNDTTLMEIIANIYASELISFATDLDGLDDAQFSTKFTKGPFQGRTLKQIFHTITPYDVRAFFNFVNSFPGKYIGTPWKINETFATWVINNAPAGEKDRNWLMDAVEATSMRDIDELLTHISYYIANDTLYTWNERVYEYEKDKNFDQEQQLLEKTIYIAEYLHDTAAMAAMHYRRSYMKHQAKDNKGALADMLYAYSLYPGNDNYAWQVAVMYAHAERYDSSFLLFDTLIRRYPDVTDIHAQYGWFKTLAGKFDEGATLCRIAYNNNPYSSSTAVNYGHTFLLRNQLDSAKYYYSKMLENLKSPDDYIEGPKKDFEIFFSKGWQRSTVADIAEWLDNEFKKTYQYTTVGSELDKEAKKLYNEGKYKKAIVKFREYLSTISKLEKPDMDAIYFANMYLGHCYYNTGQRDSTIKFYTVCLELAKGPLANKRGSQADNDHITSSYDRLANYYQDSLHDVRTAATFKMLYNAEVQKLSDMNNTAHMHIICMAGSDTTTGSPFTSNAKVIFDSLVSLGNSKDTAAVHVYLSGQTLTKKNLLQKLSDIRQRSQPEDIFIFYYSGHTITVNDKEMLCFNFADTENGCIEAKELLQNIDQVYAKKKMVITDDPEPQLFGLISSQYTSANASANEIIFFCPAVKTPVTAAGRSMFTTELINSMSALRKKDRFSAREFVDKASYTLGRGEHYLPVLSFSYGRDFVLYKTDSVIAAEKVQTRGLAIRDLNDNNDANGASASTGQKNYALFFADNVYDDNNTWHNLSNPISDATALGQLLEEDFGFQVEIVKNANKKDIENKLREYRNRSYGPNDQLMIFFAGHGIYYPDANMGYLVAKDSKEPSHADPNFNTYLSYSDLGNLYLKNMKCRRIFLVLDACYAGSFFEEKGYHRGADMFGNDKSVQQRLNMLKKNASGKSYYKGISSGGKETVEDGKKDQHSPFAGGLIAMLNAAIASQYITADAIIGEIQNYHPGNTTPSSGTFNYSDPQGLFIFEAKTDQKTDFKTDHFR